MTTFEKSILIKASEHQREGRLINFRAATLCNEVETGGIGRVLIQLVTKEGAQREWIRTATGDGSLAGEVFEKTDHELS